MKIGRGALDEDAIRLIEELNPFVEFDWPRILKGQDQPASEPRVPVEVRRPRGERRHERPAPRSEALPPERPPSEPVAEEPERPAPAVADPPVELADFKEALEQQADVDVIVAAHAKIGSEGVARLRARHTEINARIAERITDPARREELEAQANRLSPDAWITEADVTQGLDQYESVLASLREVVGRKRRRRRRGGGRGAENPDGRELGGSDTHETDEDGQTSELADTSESREEPPGDEDPGL